MYEQKFFGVANVEKVYLFDVERQMLEFMSQGIKEKESFKLEKVKERVRTAFELRVEIVIAKIETAEKVNKLLSPEQFNWWKN